MFGEVGFFLFSFVQSHSLSLYGSCDRMVSTISMKVHIIFIVDLCSNHSLQQLKHGTDREALAFCFACTIRTHIHHVLFVGSFSCCSVCYVPNCGAKEIKHAEWVVLFTGLQPVLFDISYSCLAEAPTALVLVASYWLHLKGSVDGVVGGITRFSVPV